MDAGCPVGFRLARSHEAAAKILPRCNGYGFDRLSDAERASRDEP